MSSRRKRERINYAELESLPRDADVTRRLVREAVEPAIEAITAAMPAGPPVDTGLMAAAASLGGVAKTADAFGKASARIATALLSAGSCTLTPCQPPPPGVETVPQGTLLSADWMRATGFRRPVLVARAEDCGATLPPPAALPPQRLAELCAADDSPAQVMEVAAQAEEALGWSVASYVSQYWADPGSREALLALPAADLEGSALADAVRLPQPVRELDWARRFPAPAGADGGPVGSPAPGRLMLALSPAGSWLDFSLLLSGEARWRGVVSGEEVVVAAPGTPSNLLSLRRWQRQCEAEAKARRADSVDAAAAAAAWGGTPPHSRAAGSLLVQPWAATPSAAGAVTARVRPGQVLLVPEGWILAVYAPADTVTVHGAFAPGLDIPAALRGRRAAAALALASADDVSSTAVSLRRRRNADPSAWATHRAFGGWGELLLAPAEPVVPGSAADPNALTARAHAAGPSSSSSSPSPSSPDSSSSSALLGVPAAARRAAAELDDASGLSRDERQSAVGAAPAVASPLDWRALAGLAAGLLRGDHAADACASALDLLAADGRAIAARAAAAIAAERAGDDDGASAASAAAAEGTAPSGAVDERQAARAEDGWQLSDEESGAADDDEEEEEEEEAFVPGAYGMDDEEDDDDDGAMGEDFVDEDEDDEAFDEEDEDFNPRRKRAKKTTAKAKRAAAARGAPKAAKAASSSVKIKIGGGAAAAANPSVKVRIGAGRGASGAVPARAAATAQPAAPVRAAKPAAPVSARASVKAMRARVKAMRRR
ncbi:hypothetical protein FNF29_01660 [Cafeteria roenbergensis]|uniref:JmjC domain-containing protein n=1 Tax=Cafeteria roenbergensis TaxID=33653 RepID=A0A5A8CRN0_CAFRO|nr:hypothetical protein FNF29_01660 [Cafeteria roenbergensis]|eukprot:KAA0155745.1 hypothetical protein FNF29_01660 [Cafeteria roenbergensis]